MQQQQQPQPQQETLEVGHARDHGGGEQAPGLLRQLQMLDSPLGILSHLYLTMPI